MPNSIVTRRSKVYRSIALIFSTISVFFYSNCSNTPRKSLFAEFETFKIGVNYYPRGKLWQDFWSRYDRNEIEQDFQVIRKYDLRLVRIFLYQAIFEDPARRSQAISDLRHMIDTAERNQLKLIITSFDWSKPYRFPLQLDKHSQFYLGLVEIMELFSSRPGVYAWDLKNEPDHDFDTDGKEIVLNWLGEAISQLRLKFPASLLTIGWLQPPEDKNVAQHLTFLSFHHFPEQHDLDERIDKIKKQNPKIPVMLEEVGQSTYQTSSSSASNKNDLETRQQQFIADALASSIKGELTGLLIWNLYDHPANVGPKRPAREDHFGILRNDGSPKSSALMLKSGIYSNHCKTTPKQTPSIGACMSSSGNNSMIMLRWKHNLLPEISGEKIPLKRGYHCFCLDSLHDRIMTIMGYDPQIEYAGLSSLSGSFDLQGGSVILDQ